MKSLKKTIGALDAESATRLASLASDVTMVLDRDGVIKDLAVSNDSLSKETDIIGWVGRRWADTVTIESQPKIGQLLKDAGSAARQPLQWRQVNHPVGTGRLDLPMRYAVLALKPNGPLLALGRELRSLALIQQKLLESQQSIEREYARARYAEMRYRLLFQVSNEAVLILDAATLRVLEANPAAQRLLGPVVKRIAGKAFTEIFDGANQTIVQRMLDSLRGSGRADPITVKLAGVASDVAISGSLFKQEQSNQLLIKVQGGSEAVVADGQGAETSLKTLVDNMPDAFVVTDTDRRVLMGNAAFLALAELVTPDQIRGQSIDRWIGRSPAEMGLLIGSLREHGSVRRFRTIVRGELGSSEDVEISAVAIENGPQPSLGFTIRAEGPRAESHTGTNGAMPYPVNHLTSLVGQVPLKNLVRETTDLIERMCIEAALQIVGDNRASAAEMLGLSRQSLYLKLRRYGLGDLDSEE